MSAAEFGRWVDYFNKYGRCGPVRMFDAGVALICWKIDHIMGGSTEVKDYLPKWDQETVVSVQEAIKDFGGVFAR